MPRLKRPSQRQTVADVAPAEASTTEETTSEPETAAES